MNEHEAPVSLAPTRKVASGALGGAVATLVLWIIDVTGVELPQAVAAAIATIVVFAVAYLVPSE